LFNAHSAEECAHDVLARIELTADLFAKLSFRDLNVFTNVARFLHQRQEVVFRDVHKLIVKALHHRHVHVVSGGTDIFILLLIVKINANHVNLSVAVLASL